MRDEIERLREEYTDLHERVLAAYRSSDTPDIADMQRREVEIVERLRALGCVPYE